MTEVRINKYLSEAGVCSRRQADKMVEAGKVFIDGTVAQMGSKVTEKSIVSVDGKIITCEEKPILLAVNKPRGIVCTTAEIEKDNIVNFLKYPTRIYPIGRLDKDSEGLILMTNQGEIVNKILRGSNHHEKEYYVRVDKPLTEAFLKAMRQGVPILDTITRPCIVTQSGPCEFRIILTQGLNRQIRRMCEFLGMRVLYLKRVRIMNIQLAGLQIGQYREIEGNEYEKLMDLLEDSSNLSYKQRQVQISNEENTKIINRDKQSTTYKLNDRFTTQDITSKKSKELGVSKNSNINFTAKHSKKTAVQKGMSKVKRNRT